MRRMGRLRGYEGWGFAGRAVTPHLPAPSGAGPPFSLWEKSRFMVALSRWRGG